VFRLRRRHLIGKAKIIRLVFKPTLICLILIPNVGKVTFERDRLQFLNCDRVIERKQFGGAGLCYRAGRLAVFAFLKVIMNRGVSPLFVSENLLFRYTSLCVDACNERGLRADKLLI
jgi:hypothetical protein